MAATVQASLENQEHMVCVCGRGREQGQVRLSRVEQEGGCLSDTFSSTLGISAWSVWGILKPGGRALDWKNHSGPSIFFLQEAASQWTEREEDGTMERLELIAFGPSKAFD